MPRACDQDVVVVDEGSAQPGREQTTHRRLSRGHEADEHDVARGVIAHGTYDTQQRKPKKVKVVCMPVRGLLCSGLSSRISIDSVPMRVPPARILFPPEDRAEILARIDEALTTGQLTLGPIGARARGRVREAPPAAARGRGELRHGRARDHPARRSASRAARSSFPPTRSSRRRPPRCTPARACGSSTAIPQTMAIDPADLEPLHRPRHRGRRHRAHRRARSRPRSTRSRRLCRGRGRAARRGRRARARQRVRRALGRHVRRRRRASPSTPPRSSRAARAA